MYKHTPQMEFQLQSIQLENFKCFKKSPEILFSKLTILTGANSSGKSSIIQGIMGTLQSKGFPFVFSSNGRYVNMGDFSDMVHLHKVNSEIKISTKFYAEKENVFLEIKTGWKRNRINNLPTLNSLKCNGTFFKLSITKKNKKYYLDYTYNPDKDPEVTPQSKSALETIFSVIKLPSQGEQSNSSDIVDPSNDYFLPRKFNNLEVVIDENGDIQNINSDNLRTRIYWLKGVFTNIEAKSNLISSFRLHPSRTHLEQSQDVLKVKKFGEGYLDQIIKWENSKNPKLQDLISTTTDLGLIYSIETKRMGGGRYDQIVTTSNAGIKDSLSDVGFGISQFLPILVADLQLHRGSLLIVAEPEIHLHPRVQSRFGSYIVKCVNEKNKHYILETHSEYLLNRLRLSIVKGDLQEKDLRVYYLENKKGEAVISQLKFNKKGAIENAPKDFFDTYLMDVKEIALNVE